MAFGDLEWLIPVLALIGFVVGFLITMRRQKIAGIEDVIDTITTKYLDERRFKFNDIVKASRLPDPVVKRAMKELEKNDIIYRTSKTGWFALNDPLIFLSEQDMIRASRLTKDDNLVYGGYQHPFFSHVELVGIYAIFFGAVILALVCGLVPDARSWLMTTLGLGPTQFIDLGIFLLFLVLMGLMTTDAIENLVSIWSRERYSVVVGERSGIAYDVDYADEFSGRIGRGQIRRVDLEITFMQKLLNRFMRVPIGDIYICCVAKAQGVKDPKNTKEQGPWKQFNNMPFPRELFFILRSIQLKSLGWRKRHARTLMLWRAKGAIPSIRF